MDNHEDFLDKFVILIPVYNEEKNIIKLSESLEKLDVKYLFVDDGSTDKTLTTLWLKDIPTICYFPNRGKSYAIKLGAKYLFDAGYSHILTLDADGQHSIDDIEKFDNELLLNEDCDIIIGNRMWNDKKMPLIRRWFNKLFSLVISKLANVSIPDTQCGFRLYSKKIFQELDLKYSRFDGESEILVKAGRAGFKIKSIPIQCIYQKNRRSKIRPFQDGLRFLNLLFRLKFCSYKKT
jgi:glycosyltransferase involved in cell wall biosynthesis